MSRAEAIWTPLPDPETSGPPGYGERLSRLLARRAVTDEAAARLMLEPTLDDLHEPGLLAGMPEAVARLVAARDEGEKVAIVGDYDVDGVSATAMLLAVFGAGGLEAEAILPHRMTEGYGFQVVHVERALASGVRVIVTADCGARSIEAANAALAADLSVIVTDHHIPGEPHDPRVIQINPHQEGCNYPYGELSGAGLAFKLAVAFAEAVERKIDPHALLRIACLGTIADLVPLTGENRTIAALGLAALGKTRSAGLQALMRVSKVKPPIKAVDVGFRLGPRLNAAGRMDSPDPALEVLMVRDPVRGDELAERLNQWNAERQRAEGSVVDEARELLLEAGELPPFLMAWHESWHRGVLGIAAGRIAREFHRPTVLMTNSEEIAVGSGRSVRGIHLHDFLQDFEDGFERFGGHSQAIGLSIRSDRLETVRETLQAAAEKWDPDLLVPRFEYEERLKPEEITLELVREVDRLEPFGAGNRRPMYRVGPLELAVPPRAFGANHLGLRARGLSGALLDLVAWRWADRRELFESPFEVLGHLKVDDYLGRASMEVFDARAYEGE